MAITVAALEERVNNHIKFFWVVVAAGFAWMGTITLLLIHVNGTASSLAQTQTQIETGLIKQNILNYAALSTDDFKATLPDLSATMAKAKRQQVKVSPKVVDDLRQKLLTADTNAPGFWPAASEFISFRSQMIAGWRDINLPLCTFAAHSGQIKSWFGPVEYSDCKIILDSPVATAELSKALSFSDTVFRRCVVFYNGGTIIVLPVKLTPEIPAQLNGTLSFEDCLFVFSFPTTPQPEGQRLARALLASSGNSIVFKPSDQG
jgi:hypothetical protein